MGSGSLLGFMVEPFREHPELLVMVPALVGLKGAVEVALGSRLCSAIHLGLWGPDRFWNEELRQNLIAALVLTLIGSLVVGLLGYGLASVAGDAVVSLAIYLSIALMAGLGAGISLAGVTVGIVWLSHRKGLDPDNVTAPLLTTAGDMVGLLWLLLAISLLIGGVV